MKKIKYNFDNLRELSNKKIQDPQAQRILLEKRQWTRNNPVYV